MAFNLRAAAKERESYAANQRLFATKSLFFAIGIHATSSRSDNRIAPQ
jgi:hypothetical protein